MMSNANNRETFDRSMRLDIAMAFVRERRAQLSARLWGGRRNPATNREIIESIKAEMLELPSLLDLPDDEAELAAETERLRSLVVAGRESQ